MLIYKHEDGGLDFQFEQEDWAANRARRFLAEFTFVVPSECLSYNGRGKVWSLDAEWADVFDAVRAKYRLPVEAQDEPFAIIRREKEAQMPLFKVA